MASVLVIGSGGREHTIAWKLAQSEKVNNVFVAPGNGGTGCMGKVSNVDISEGNHDKILSFCKEKNIDLVAVGPEIPLSAGLADKLTAEGIHCFGPCKAGAQIESSKEFSKKMMSQLGILTAKYEVFTDYEKAVAYTRSLTYPVVIKASGLAAGKGVLIPERGEEEAALKSIMIDHEFGAAGDTVIIEEKLEGEEVSLLCFTDGETVVAMPPAQDHKRALDNDMGPNTGGMGAYCPAPCLTEDLKQQAIQNVLQKLIDGMRAEGIHYCGVLYSGLMLTSQGIYVLEYNCRFGDPETQVILPLLLTDLYTVMHACTTRTLSQVDVKWREGAAVTVVCASGGYPGSYSKGHVIEGLDKVSSLPGITVFHAGTKSSHSHIVTNGGRVLAVTCVGDSLAHSITSAYDAVKQITFEGMFYRKDIGHRALIRSPRIAVLGSTKGTDLQYILDAIHTGSLSASIVCVISNIPSAFILERAKQNSIPAICVPSKGVEREAHDRLICEALGQYEVDLVLLIGYMRILSPTYFELFTKPTLNIHPSLLPEFAGGMNTDVHKAVIAAKKTITGCTVHLVTKDVDMGPILYQKICPVYTFDTVDTLKARVQKLEGESLVHCIQQFASGKLCLSGIASETVCEKDESVSYAQAGVDITEGDNLVENIKPFCKLTNRPGCNVDLGGYGGIFELAKAGFGSDDTLLVACDDGVGTKLKLAFATGIHDTVGIDLVAMSVNDLVVQAAEPLFFLDYYASGHLDVAVATQVIKGIGEGCQQARCALIGGETAEMPGMYEAGEYDLAGFAVGAVKRPDLLPKPTIPNMTVLGCASSGVHSNGFSMVRRLVKLSGVEYSDPSPFYPGKTLGESLIIPTRIYVRSVLAACKTKKVVGFAHITGGGLVENIPRVLSPNTSCELIAGSWPVLDVFRWMKCVGNVDESEMRRTFNSGIGMCVICETDGKDEVKRVLEENGETVYEIGKIIETPGESKVIIVGNLF